MQAPIGSGGGFSACSHRCGAHCTFHAGTTPSSREECRFRRRGDFPHARCPSRDDRMTEPNKQSGRSDPRPGRPRDPEVDRAILQATLRVLTDQGICRNVYRAGSRAEAGVGKTAIYRRYSSKEELAASALRRPLEHEWGPPPDTGCARQRHGRDVGPSPRPHSRAARSFPMLGALLVEERRNPELFELFRERVMRPRRDDAMKVLQRGVERGEIRADAALEVAIHAMVGSILARHIIGSPDSMLQIEETVDSIWRCLASDPQE